MDLKGTQKFAAPTAEVFNAILNPEVLKASIPGADSVSYVSPDKLRVGISLPFPGLHGPFTVYIHIPNRQAPSLVEFAVEHGGKGGKAEATCRITLADEAGSTVLSYHASAKLEGLISVADNPLGKGVVNSKLTEFFKNLEKEVAKARV